MGGAATLRAITTDQTAVGAKRVSIELLHTTARDSQDLATDPTRRR